MVAERYRAIKNHFEHLVAQLPVSGDLSFKDMFGGVCVYTQGRPFATFAGDTLALKLPEAAQAEVRAEGAGDPNYEPEAPGGKQYITLPASLMAHEDKLLYWIEDSLRYVQSMPPKKRRK